MIVVRRVDSGLEAADKGKNAEFRSDNEGESFNTKGGGKGGCRKALFLLDATPQMGVPGKGQGRRMRFRFSRFRVLLRERGEERSNVGR